MNPLKKAYCRTFQAAFKAALPFLPYRKPKIISSVQKLPAVIHKHQCRHVLMVTDSGIRGLGLTKDLEQALSASFVACTIYDKTTANPTTEHVAEAVKLYRTQGCDAIIGFGGGSSIDCAKAAGACIARPKKTPEQMKGILKVRRRLPLLIAVPTTAGTGSETTLASVITDSGTRHKYAINDFPLIPRYAVLDPKITVSLPPFLTATTGMDALTHAVEAFIGNSTTPGTRKDALEAVQLIFENLDTAYHSGADIKARKAMLRASFYAGCAFTKSYVGYVHAVSHSLSGQYNVPHGFANAVLLPFMLESYIFSQKGCPSQKRFCKKLYLLAVAAHAADKGTPYSQAAAQFIQAIKDMNRRFGIGTTIKEIRKEDIPKMAHYADKEANPLYPVPVLMDSKELEQFYYLLSS